MAQTYKQIAKQIAALQKEADRLREEEVKEVVERIKSTIAEYGLTAADLGFSPFRPRAGAVKKRAAGNAAKFRDDQGNTWGGRGPRPAWLREQIASGKALEDFLA